MNQIERDALTRIQSDIHYRVKERERIQWAMQGVTNMVDASALDLTLALRAIEVLLTIAIVDAVPEA
jgi:hypothetical protein